MIGSSFTNANKTKYMSGTKNSVKGGGGGGGGRGGREKEGNAEEREGERRITKVDDGLKRK